MKLGRIVGCLCFLLVSLLGSFSPVLAQNEEEKLEMESTYSKLESTSPGVFFEFEVALKYQGSEPRTFDLVATGPQDWSTYITPSYPKEKRIRDIRLEPGKDYPDKINITTSPPVWLVPEPGEYEVTLEASSGSISNSIELKAIVTAKYSLGLVPTEELYSTKTTAGKDNYFSVEIQNQGSAALDDIKLSSSKPRGWTIDFTPDKIDSVSPQSYQTIDVNIKPDAKAIAGDYEITLTVDTKQSIKSIDIRVTVETPTVWGWVGVAIILVVIAGVGFIFVRFSRR